MPSWHAPKHLAYYCKGQPGSIRGTRIQDGTGFEAWHGQEKMFRPALQPTQPPISWVLGVKQPWHEADCLPLICAEAKNDWRYTFPPPSCLHGMDGDKFTFTLPSISKRLKYMLFMFILQVSVKY